MGKEEEDTAQEGESCVLGVEAVAITVAPTSFASEFPEVLVLLKNISLL